MFGGFAIAREDPRAADVRALLGELDAYLFALYPAESNHILDVDSLAGADVAFFVIRREGAPVACGALVNRDGDYGELKRLYVKPESRGQGLSRIVLAQIETAARLLQLPAIRLETGTRQPEALRFFEAAGFARCGVFGDYPADDPYCVFMEKAL
ncbi:MAG: GNAT family N-acetyltransferase [Hyphomicrobiales bacterium]